MGLLDQSRFLERLQFFNGQRLFASDLQALEGFSREMRWLHNASLHQPGIGNGFAVYGKKGDREVTIGPGYAIDALGREIVLIETQLLPVPPVAGDDIGQPVFYDLVVAYPEDADLEEAETREGICSARGVVRLREAPVFCWVRLEKDELGNLRARNPLLGAAIKDGMKIVLARAEVLNCQLNQDLSVAQRRSARPAKQPYIACGVADPTGWSFWRIDEAVIGLTATIDTAGAAFLTPPCYSARIEGPRPILVPTTDTANIPRIFFDGPVYVQDSQVDRFTVYVLFSLIAARGVDSGGVTLAPFAVGPGSQPAAAAAMDEDDLALFADWNIVWMGIEG